MTVAPHSYSPCRNPTLLLVSYDNRYRCNERDRPDRRVGKVTPCCASKRSRPTGVRTQWLRDYQAHQDKKHGAEAKLTGNSIACQRAGAGGRDSLQGFSNLLKWLTASVSAETTTNKGTCLILCF
jgi:hypothetical protein